MAEVNWSSIASIVVCVGMKTNNSERDVNIMIKGKKVFYDRVKKSMSI